MVILRNIMPQPMGKWDTKPDLNIWQVEGGSIYPKTFDKLPDNSPVQLGDILRVTGGLLVIENEERFL